MWTNSLNLVISTPVITIFFRAFSHFIFSLLRLSSSWVFSFSTLSQNYFRELYSSSLLFIVSFKLSMYFSSLSISKAISIILFRAYRYNGLLVPESIYILSISTDMRTILPMAFCSLSFILLIIFCCSSIWIFYLSTMLFCLAISQFSSTILAIALVFVFSRPLILTSIWIINIFIRSISTLSRLISASKFSICVAFLKFSVANIATCSSNSLILLSFITNYSSWYLINFYFYARSSDSI